MAAGAVAAVMAGAETSAEVAAVATTMVATIEPLGKRKKLCPNCNKTVVHEPADCISLEANKNKRSVGWGVKRGK